ncbi:MAG: methyltransferase domain-containing protein [Myxococcales bacterium]|nr:methyltransferase domain-containing protein [Myxococcales bacterium]
MTSNDLEFFRLCFRLGFVRSPFLEIGSAKVQGSTPNLCEVARSLGITDAVGTDISAGPGVDFTCDFSAPAEEFRSQWARGKFSSVAIFNVLEHTFDPVGVLTNALSCVQPGGHLVVVAPAVWPLHNFPGDFVRLLPNWFEEFARRTHTALVDDAFCWLSQFGVVPVRSSPDYQLPSYLGARQSHTARYFVSRIVHRAFNTYGRSHAFTHAAIGAVMCKDD